MAIGLNGSPYIVDASGPWAWKLRCDCGHEWEVEEATFPGRRAVKSCGRVECPHTPKIKVKRTAEQKGFSQSVYMSRDVIAYVEQWGVAHGYSFSKATEDIIRRFWAWQMTLDD